MIWTVSNPDQHSSVSHDASMTTVFLLEISLLCFIVFILAHQVEGIKTCQKPPTWKLETICYLNERDTKESTTNHWNEGWEREVSHLLYPFEHWRDTPRVLVDDGSKAFWKHSRYVIRKTTTSNMSYSFYTSLANNIKHLFSRETNGQILKQATVKGNRIVRKHTELK